MMINAEELVGLIPAAGRGLRLGLPYPKELYPVIRNNKYKPIAQFVLENLTSADVRHIVFVINESKHQLIGYFGDGSRFGCRLSYVVQEVRGDENLAASPGLAHALDSAYHLTKHRTVFFGMADTIMRPTNVFDYVYASINPDDDILLALFETDYPQKFGMVRLEQDDRVLEIVDKPKKTNLTKMWGCIIWRPHFTEYLHDCVSRQGLGDFAQILNLAIVSGLRCRAVHVPQGTYIDLGTYEEIAELDRRFRDA